MENDMENTVENTQDDNNAIKSMRERIKELEGVEKEYKSVQMGNAIKDAGFTISFEEAERIQRSGLTQTEARRLFATAGEQLPQLQELQAQRGVQQEQRIGLTEFTEAAVFQSPEELGQIRRLQEEQASEFAPTTGAARTGRRVSGLTEL